MNHFLKSIEEEGRKYGLMLNKDKCELLSTSLNADIKFENGTKVKRKPEVTYLGCQINQYSNIAQELSKGISNCMATLKKLDIFWRHCDIQTAFTITTLDAVIRAKLLYGLDSAQLTPSQQRRIEVFQLKGLRKILNMKTTYVERNNTNAEIFRKANELIQNQTEAGTTLKRIKEFVKAYKNSRMKRLTRIFQMSTDHPVRHITFANNHPNPNLISPWIPPDRRVGRPRFKWVTETLNDMWINMASTHPNVPQVFDKQGNEHQHTILKQEMHSPAPRFLFKD